MDAAALLSDRRIDSSRERTISIRCEGEASLCAWLAFWAIAAAGPDIRNVERTNGAKKREFMRKPPKPFTKQNRVA
jgi:hypothetical protein